jgi:hypothetical protein
LQGRYQPDNHVLVDRWCTLGGHLGRRRCISAFLSGGCHGSSSGVQVSHPAPKYTLCVHEVYNDYLP